MALRDRLRKAFGLPVRTFDEPRVARFATFPVDQLVLHMQSRLGTVSREEALGVPAVLRGRNLICSISTLPLEAIDADNRLIDHPLLRQVDPNVPNVVTLAMTAEDLLFEGVSWWRVTAFGWDGYPVEAVRYAPDQVSMTPPKNYRHGYLPSGLPTEPAADLAGQRGKGVWMGGEFVLYDQVIRFDSPNPALLTSGQRPISRAIALDEAAKLFADNPRMRGYFSPKDPTADPDGNDDRIIAALDAWEEARRERVDGYIPAALEYNTVQDATPADLQLVQLQEKATKDIANALGIDPEELGVSTTSRTYANQVDRRKDRINDTLSPYMAAITQRLSMPDVTKHRVRVRFSLDDYLRADPKTRAEVQQMYAEMGVTDAAEIRHAEGLPPRAIQQPARLQGPAAKPIPATVGEPVSQIEASDRAELTFARETGLTFEIEPDATFAVDTEARTITGLAVPWNQAARSQGRRWRFARGSVKYSAVNRVKLLRDHDNSQAIGKAISLDDTDEGLVATFKVSPGRAGDEALGLALDGVLDGLSIGVDFRDTDFGPDPKNPGANLVHQAALREVSLTAVPSFDDSRLTSVKASRDEEGPGMPEEQTTETAPADQPVTIPDEQIERVLARFSATREERPVIDPTRSPTTAVTQVAEALPYRFAYDGGRHVFRNDAEHDFSTDLMTLLRGTADRDVPGERVSAARQRIDSLISATFADVESADVTALNPNRHRPDLWQAQMDLPTPLWDMVASGTTDGTKFDVPKFTSSANLVGPATEKVEPAAGSMVAELQTITPTQVWGKVEITRQAWRAGGSPQLSGILWDQMLREYYEDREAAVATFLATLTAAANVVLTATPASSPDNDDDQVTVGELEEAISDLQFSRGGRQIRAFAVHQALFRVLARVKDDAGRPLYPIINPSNANGTSQPRFQYIDIAGVRAVGAGALGTVGTDETSSWLFDPAKVRGWASAPERLFWDFGATVQTANIPQLSFVTLGIYGDVAFANLDIAGVREVIYDPSS
jgi:HK97 family phage prohead protease